MDPATARKHMLSDPIPNPSAIELEVIEFGKIHRDCNIRVIAE